MIIKGNKYPIVGNICMNITMVNVTDSDIIKSGNKVIILGKDGDKEITAEEIAKQYNTISYETLTSLGDIHK